MWPCQCRVQGDSHCSGPAGCTIPGTARMPLAFLASWAGSCSATADQCDVGLTWARCLALILISVCWCGIKYVNLHGSETSMLVI